MATLTVEVSDQAILKTLATLKARGADLYPLMDEIGSALVASTLRRFETQSGPDGQGWPALSRSTLRQRGHTARMLQARGHLRQSITHRAMANAVEVGTNLVYAAIHQFGGKIEKYAASLPIYRKQADLQAGRAARFVKKSKSDFMSYHEVGAHTVTIPARPYLGIDADDQTAIAEIILGHLAESAP